jgi:hypothetical protein
LNEWANNKYFHCPFSSHCWIINLMDDNSNSKSKQTKWWTITIINGQFNNIVSAGKFSMLGIYFAFPIHHLRISEIDELINQHFMGKIYSEKDKFDHLFDYFWIKFPSNCWNPEIRQSSIELKHFHSFILCGIPFDDLLWNFKFDNFFIISIIILWPKPYVAHTFLHFLQFCLLFAGWTQCTMWAIPIWPKWGQFHCATANLHFRIAKSTFEAIFVDLKING